MTRDQLITEGRDDFTRHARGNAYARLPEVESSDTITGVGRDPERIAGAIAKRVKVGEGGVVRGSSDLWAAGSGWCPALRPGRQT